MPPTENNEGIFRVPPPGKKEKPWEFVVAPVWRHLFGGLLISELIMTPLQKNLKQRISEIQWVILQSGILQSGILQSPATNFGAGNPLTCWDPTVWDPTVWDPTIWDPTVSGYQFWSR